MRQENNHSIYYNSTMVAIPNEFSTSRILREFSTDKKGAQEVCEPTSGSILARVDYV